MDNNKEYFIGKKVIITKSDFSEVTGTVLKISKQEIILALSNNLEGFETNYYFYIKDENGIEHMGYFKSLFVDKVIKY